MKSLLRMFMVALFATLCFVSCDDDNKKPNVNLTPEENKQKLEDIGVAFMGKINPQDHKELIQTLQAFEELLNDEDLPTLTEGGRFARNMKRIVAKNDLGKLAAYNSVESEIYQVKDYYAIYTYNETSKEWDKEESETMLQYNFVMDKQKVAITLSASGKEVELEIDEETTLMIPAKAEATVKKGSNELGKLTLENTINTNNNAVDLKTTLSASGYVLGAESKFSETLAIANFSMKKGNETLVSGNCKVTGESMTDIDVIEDIDDIEDLFKSAEAYIQIMDDVNVTASCSDIQKMVKELEKLEDKYDFNSNADEKAYAEEEAVIVNKYTNAVMRYNGSSETIATIEFQAYLAYESTWSGKTYQEWEIEPVLVFRVDDSRYSFEDYFGENGFGELIKSFEKLEKEYRSFLKK